MAKVRGSFDPHHARINCSEQKLPYSCGNVYRFERMHSCSSTRWRYTIQFAKVSAVNAYYIMEPEVTFRGHLTTFAHVLLIKPWGRGAPWSHGTPIGTRPPSIYIWRVHGVFLHLLKVLSAWSYACIQRRQYIYMFLGWAQLAFNLQSPNPLSQVAGFSASHSDPTG